MSKEKSFNEKLTEIVIRTWDDKKFHKEFFENPRKVLKDHGIIVPANVRLKVEEGDSFMFSIVIPSKSKAAEQLEESELRMASGGGCGKGGYTC